MYPKSCISLTGSISIIGKEEPDVIIDSTPIFSIGIELLILKEEEELGVNLDVTGNLKFL